MNRGKSKKIVRYTVTQLQTMRTQSMTDLSKVKAISEEELERIVAKDERDIHPDWTRAKLVEPKKRKFLS